MTTLELNAKKTELIRSILNDINSEEILDELSNVVKRLTGKEFPCMYSPEEIRDRADSVIQGYKEGRGVTQEEMRKRHFA